MTDQLRQAAQQALDALELSAVTVDSFGVQKATQAAITALRTALAMHQVSEFAQAQEQQAETPPEWPLVKNILDEYGLQAISFVAEFKAAQRPWVGLTPEEVKHLYPYGRSIWGKETFEAIEKALKAKNNG